MSEFENSYTKQDLEELLAYMDGNQVSKGTTRVLARALLAEMDKPGDVWKDAPVTATKALVAYYTNISGCIGQATYTRELPKSRARVIAEEARSQYERGAIGAGSLDDVIESAILKALAEKEAGK